MITTLLLFLFSLLLLVLGKKRSKRAFSLLFLAIKFILAAIVLSWPLLFWSFFYFKTGEVPRTAFLNYSISNWWDVVFWLCIMGITLSMDAFTDEISFLKNRVNIKVIISVFLLALIFFLCGAVYVFISFVVFFLIYFLALFLSDLYQKQKTKICEM